ncbi:type II toxin-antitoxin system RelE/ParE family toxin [Candidatus Woesearchaeota archaeon]|nr:type II toxin-antitoxin system RelE/ParE family toxin [Candidatus Woesearchaeota archaeon]
MYTITFSSIGLKQFQKLEQSIQQRIIDSLERCKIRPYAHIKKLVGSPYFALRVGDYRIVLRVIENKLEILIVQIGHRKNFYKK